MRYILATLLTTLTLYAEPVSHRSQTYSILNDLLSQVFSEAGINSTSWDYSIAGDPALSAYLSGIMEAMQGDNAETTVYMLAVTNPFLELNFEAGASAWNTKMKRQLKIEMDIEVREISSGESVLSRSFSQQGSDMITTSDFQFLRNEQFPVPASGVDSIGGRSSGFKVILSSVSIGLVALLFFMRTS